jgi:hypothetical protein
MRRIDDDYEHRCAEHEHEHEREHEHDYEHRCAEHEHDLQTEETPEPCRSPKRPSLSLQEC